MLADAMNNAPLRTEMDYLYYGASLCEGRKCDRDGTWQIAPFFGSIPFHEKSHDALTVFDERIAKRFPELSEYGRRRANKAYASQKDTTTKPSYTNRLSNFPGAPSDQLESILGIGAREPSSGGLVFSVFHPKDLTERQRPGYVPCLVSGSILLSERELQINAFFRSQSVIEFALYDLLFLRQLQKNMLSKLKDRSKKFERVTPGALNILAARVFVKRRLCRVGNTQYLYRSDTYDAWLHEIAEVKRQLSLD